MVVKFPKSKLLAIKEFQTKYYNFSDYKNHIEINENLNNILKNLYETNLKMFQKTDKNKLITQLS